MEKANKKRWITAIPMTYADGVGFWDRDSGLQCLGFRERGFDSQFVALGTPATRSDVPLILCRHDDLENAEWWKGLAAQVVLLNAWAAPRYEPIARAIKASGTKLVVRVDSDGVKSPRIWFRRFLETGYAAFRDQHHPFASLAAITMSVMYYAIPDMHDAGMIRHLSHADVIAIESPLAQQRLARLLFDVGRLDLARRIRVIPHPVSTRFRFDPSVPKQRRLIAVGRWDAYIKDAPLLVRSLARVLTCAPNYSASIIGPGEDILRRLLRTVPTDVRARFELLGRIANADLVRHYQEAEVIVVSSRSESFHIASAEALCCGCSVAGPAIVSSMNFFASARSGTLATLRTAEHLSDAVLAEIEAWRLGERDPRSISEHWAGLVHAPNIATKLDEICP